MAEDDTPYRDEEDEEAAPIVVPAHDPLPLPPDVPYTRPTLNRRVSASQSGSLPSSSDPERESAAGHGAGLAAGFTFVASILAGLLAGSWLDQHYNHSGTPWGMMVMTVAGAGVGFTQMSRLLSRGGRRKP